MPPPTHGPGGSGSWLPTREPDVVVTHEAEHARSARARGVGPLRSRTWLLVGAHSHCAPSSSIAPSRLHSLRMAHRIVYIAGSGRSGSTLLDRLLGQLPRWWSCGELAHIWSRGFQHDQRCGCSKPFSRCPFWSQVRLDLAAGDADAAAHLQASVARLRHLPALLRPRGSFAAKLRRYQAILDRLHRAIARQSGATTLVDSSKSAQHLAVLAGLPHTELAVIHLIRDPRAVAFSWTRARRRPEVAKTIEMMPRYSAVRSGAEWQLMNVLCERIASRAHTCMRVHYEDLVRDPAGVLEHIAARLGAAYRPTARQRQREFDLGENHTVAGNPVRFDTGTVSIRGDDIWRTAASRRWQRLAGAASWPTARRYGYG
ncbi:MAG: sulfotransferase [Myxococcales bacterium FL481]|nr:MAG: sulfotransferase [Myxococcales bacterium FL481]